mgnify:CR=1 FL=1
MNNIEQIAGVGKPEVEIHWIEYPAGTCFECRVGLLRESDGSFSIYAINLPGVASQGETEPEAIANIVDALAGALVEYKSEGEIPWADDFIEGEIFERRVIVNLAEVAVAG